MRVTVKTHKNPMGFRFITNASWYSPLGLNALTQAVCTCLVTCLHDHLDQLATRLRQSNWNVGLLQCCH
jgi:hypothetical protein